MVLTPGLEESWPLNPMQACLANTAIGPKVHGGLCKQMQNGFLPFGISAWNLYAGFLSNVTFRETLQFVNRHAGYMNASTAPAAFISFRDSLNTEDTKRWPEAKYGKVAEIPWTNGTLPPNCNANEKRMKLIAEDFQKYGAKLESAKEASDPRSVIQKRVCISMMYVGTAGLEIISDILSKLNLLKHPWGGGGLVQNTKDMEGLPEG